MTMMFDGTLRSETRYGLQRARGEGEVGFSRKAGRTALAHLHQAGCCKIRLPKVHGSDPEAVFLNTAGGLTGGDRITYGAAVDDAAAAVFTTQACERVYRSTGDDAVVENRLRLGADARADWLPQETIVFDGGRLRRSFEVDLSVGAVLLAVESVILGREAMGETLRSGAFRDRWRIRRDGRLIFADDTRLPDTMAAGLSGPATLGGARAFATLVMAAPKAPARVDALRALDPGDGFGVSALDDDLLVCRLIAAGGEALRAALTTAIDCLRDGRPMPRVWHT